MDITKDIQPMTAFRDHSAEFMRQGLRDLASGDTSPAREVFDEIRAEHDIPR
jgi:hypothetical protein